MALKLISDLKFKTEYYTDGQERVYFRITIMIKNYTISSSTFSIDKDETDTYLAITRGLEMCLNDLANYAF